MEVPINGTSINVGFLVIECLSKISYKIVKTSYANIVQVISFLLFIPPFCDVPLPPPSFKSQERSLIFELLFLYKSMNF